MQELIKKVSKISYKILNSFYKPIKENILFFHIPKCGGTSIQRAIENCYYPIKNNSRGYIHLDNTASYNSGLILSKINRKELDDGNLVDDYYVLKVREYLMLFYLCQKYRFINGHFHFSRTAHNFFKQEYVFITVLRDPVKRWISEYLYNRYKKFDYRKNDIGIEEYLKSKYGKSQGHQFVKFLGGPSEKEDYTSHEAIQRAKENTEKIDIIGFIEQLDQFVNQFNKRFGKKLKIEHINKSTVSIDTKNEYFSKDILERIQDICKPDIEVYRYAAEKSSKLNY